MFIFISNIKIDQNIAASGILLYKKTQDNQYYILLRQQEYNDKSQFKQFEDIGGKRNNLNFDQVCQNYLQQIKIQPQMILKQMYNIMQLQFNNNVQQEIRTYYSMIYFVLIDDQQMNQLLNNKQWQIDTQQQYFQKINSLIQIQQQKVLFQKQFKEICEQIQNNNIKQLTLNQFQLFKEVMIKNCHITFLHYNKQNNIAEIINPTNKIFIQNKVYSESCEDAMKREFLEETSEINNKFFETHQLNKQCSEYKSYRLYCCQVENNFTTTNWRTYEEYEEYGIQKRRKQRFQWQKLDVQDDMGPVRFFIQNQQLINERLLFQIAQLYEIIQQKQNYCYMFQVYKVFRGKTPNTLCIDLENIQIKESLRLYKYDLWCYNEQRFDKKHVLFVLMHQMYAKSINNTLQVTQQIENGQIIYKTNLNIQDTHLSWLIRKFEDIMKDVFKSFKLKKRVNKQ